jgi:hypothetical protein
MSSVTLHPTMKSNFILTLILRSLALSWRVAILLALLTASSLPATTVLFPLQVMTGSRVSRAILIQPDLSTNQIVNTTNLVGQTPIVVWPTNGIGRAVLLPWSYTVRVDGWPRSFHIVVPDSTNTLSAANLITNSVSIGTPNIFGLGSVTTSNTTSVTFSGDGTSTNPLAATASMSLNNVVLTGSNYLGSKISSGAPLGINPQGQYSVAFGIFPDATGYAAFAMGEGTTASGTASHAVGKGTTASGTYSMAEGNLTAASGYAAHAEGDSTSASGVASSAGGSNAHADHDNTFVWADGTETHSRTNNEVTLYAANGYRLLGGPIEGRFTFTNAAGARFALIVNGTTNGFTFVPVP